MSTSSFLLGEALGRYYRDVAVREPAWWAALHDETARLPGARMQIAPEQAQLLALLVRLIQARRTIEVGVFTGSSTLAVAEALPPDGEVLACDLSRDWTAIAQRHWQAAGVAQKVRLVLGPALQTLDGELAAGAAGRYDFAFIDADKQGTPAYYERCLRLVRRNGLIAVDNTLWSGRVADPAVQDADTAAIRAFNAQAARDDRVDLCLVPIADGLTLLRVR